jgi:hypothetical protein
VKCWTWKGIIVVVTCIKKKVMTKGFQSAQMFFKIITLIDLKLNPTTQHDNLK